MSSRRNAFVVAAVQMRSTTDRQRNIATAERYAEQAVRTGASLVAYPENVAYLRAEGEARPPAEDQSGPTFRAFAAIAKRHRVHVLALDGRSYAPESPTVAQGECVELATEQLFEDDLGLVARSAEAAVAEPRRTA